MKIQRIFLPCLAWSTLVVYSMDPYEFSKSAMINNVKGVEQLIARNQQLITTPGQFGMTLLHQAAKQGDQAMMQLIIDNCPAECIRTVINMQDNQGYTPLHLAVAYSHAPMVQLLIDYHASTTIYNHDGDTPLHSAAGNEEMVRLLLDNGACSCVNKPNLRKSLPIHRAALTGTVAAVKLLLDRGAIQTVDTPNEFDDTPLLIAAGQGKADIVALLVEYKAQVNTSNLIGLTALHGAAKKGCEILVNFLLSHGARVNTDTPFVGSPLHIASRAGHETVVQLLLLHGAHANELNYRQRTPLHKAARNGRTAVVRALLAHGATQTKDVSGWTPAQLAGFYEHHDVVTLLQQESCK